MDWDVLQVLSVQQQHSGDEEAFAYNNTLRKSIFDAYSGIFNGMSREKVNQFMPQYAPVCCSLHSAESPPCFGRTFITADRVPLLGS